MRKERRDVRGDKRQERRVERRDMIEEKDERCE
jgi:hypothetical protein